MEHQLPKLPFEKQAFEPYISAETLEYHHGKHHKAYVTKLNELIKGTEFEDMELIDIIFNAEGPIFNNAAQTWNHTFFWNCLSPAGGGDPKGLCGELIKKRWSSFDEFKKKFSEKALANFGSGWTWLILDEDKELDILNTSNADNPLTHGQKPLLTLDIWEHAYYIDYRNARADFVKAFWNVIDWNLVNNKLEEALNSILTFPRDEESDINRE